MDTMISAFMMLAGLTAPEAINPEKWITQQDYPATALLKRQQGTARLRVIVSPQGRPEACHIIESSGTPTIDNAACAATKRNGRFTPARNDAGQPVYGVVNRSNNFTIPDRANPIPLGKRAEDMAIVVNKLPAGASNPLTVSVVFAVTPQGVVENCAGSADAPKSLAEIACGQVRDTLKPKPAVDKNATSVFSVQSAMIAFVVPPSN